ncbi:MAG: hypothetical protein ACJ8E3_06600 [Sphingomicrobium sp.]
MQITDSSGAPVGSVTAIQGDNLLVKTDKHEVALPKSSFTVSEGKLLFGMTRVQLNAEVEKSLAAADAAIKPGATVNGAQGTAVGTIDTTDASLVTIALESGQKIQLPRSAVRGNADGTVSIGLTAAELQAQVEKAAASAPAGK